MAIKEITSAGQIKSSSSSSSVPQPAIVGIIPAAGTTPTAGTGFTYTHTPASGIYVFTFTTPFASAPIVVGDVIDVVAPNAAVWSLTTVTASGFTAYTVDTGLNVPSDHAFGFSAFTSSSSPSVPVINGTVLYDSAYLGAPAASIDSGVFVASYKHLLVEILARSSTGATTDSVWLQFNGDTGANYNWEAWGGGTGGTATTNLQLDTGGTPGSGSAGNYATTHRVEIPYYSGTTFYKNARNLMVPAEGVLGSPDNTTGTWLNTAAITRVVAKPLSGSNFIIGSRMIIYGY